MARRSIGTVDSGLQDSLGQDDSVADHLALGGEADDHKSHDL